MTQHEAREVVRQRLSSNAIIANVWDTGEYYGFLVRIPPQERAMLVRVGPRGGMAILLDLDGERWRKIHAELPFVGGWDR